MRFFDYEHDDPSMRYNPEIDFGEQDILPTPFPSPRVPEGEELADQLVHLLETYPEAPVPWGPRNVVQGVKKWLGYGLDERISDPHHTNHLEQLENLDFPPPLATKIKDI